MENEKNQMWLTAGICDILEKDLKDNALFPGVLI
jgi:hypothetical protein